MDFVKCSWILSDIARLGDDGFSYSMPDEDISHYYDLLKVSRVFMEIYPMLLLCLILATEQENRNTLHATGPKHPNTYHQLGSI